MKRRKFSRDLIKATGAAVLSGSVLSCNQKKIEEVIPKITSKALPDNWVWLRPNTEWSDDQWKATFSELREMGIQGILPEVYSSRHTLFDHPVLPVKDRWLERIIPIAHAADLQVHAWMWSMILNNEEMIAKHPDWFSVNRNGLPSHTDPAYVDYYKFMCPCHPEVPEFVASNVEALSKIEDLDGVHLDYIRQPDVILAEGLQPKYDIVQDKEYPEYDYPYSENCRNAFKEQSGIDPMDLGDDAPAHEEWRQFRYNAISNVVNNHCIPMARKYDKKITGAVFPNWESVRQQWHKWDLDGFLPMLYQGFYNEDIPWIGEQVRLAKERLNNDKPVYAGIFTGHVNDKIDQAIEVGLENGAKGFSIFSLGGITDTQKSILKKMAVAG